MRRVLLGVVIVLAVVAGAYVFRNEIVDHARQLHPALGDALAPSSSGPFASIVKRVSPAVVTIVSKAKDPKDSAIGSGFVIDAEGHVVTNDHVINNAEKIEVHFADGTKAPAVLVGTDKPTDVALLKVTVERPLVYVSFGDDKNMEVGDWVIAIGSPDF